MYTCLLIVAAVFIFIAAFASCFGGDPVTLEYDSEILQVICRLLVTIAFVLLAIAAFLTDDIIIHLICLLLAGILWYIVSLVAVVLMNVIWLLVLRLVGWIFDDDRYRFKTYYDD